MESNLSIVIPCFNEENRLPKTLSELHVWREMNSKRVSINEIIVVSDGSQDQTAKIAHSFQADLPIKVIEYFPNRGKGYAIYQGILAVTQPWVLIADADMATPWKEMLKLLDAREKGALFAIGSRDLKDSQVQKHQSWIREYLGKSFNLFVRMLTGLSFRDTQCGFKLFHTYTIQQWVKCFKVFNFAWDVEVLIKAKKEKVLTLEIPIEWYHIEGSRIHPLKDGLKMGWAVLKMRWFNFFFRDVQVK